MSRRLRLEIAGGLYHVTSPGDRREDIYHDDADRLAWLAILAQTCERFNGHIHGWCQMNGAAVDDVRCSVHTNFCLALA